jgi:hypothetical protein
MVTCLPAGMSGLGISSVSVPSGVSWLIVVSGVGVGRGVGEAEGFSVGAGVEAAGLAVGTEPVGARVGGTGPRQATTAAAHAVSAKIDLVAKGLATAAYPILRT